LDGFSARSNGDHLSFSLSRIRNIGGKESQRDSYAKRSGDWAILAAEATPGAMGAFLILLWFSDRTKQVT
jgi:hypothetical protein